MTNASRAALALFVCFSAASSLGGCRSPAAKDRWSRHFEGDVWGGAIGEQVKRPDRYLPEGFLLATIPASFVYDSDIQKHESQHTVSNSTKFAADSLQFLLPAIPVTIGITDWAHGDDGRNFEVVAESLGGVVAIQQLLARTIQRNRPDHREQTSFPSGHTSWAFAATTLIVRDLHDPSDDSFHFTDGLLYIPAIFNAWERIAINHHWTSDVTCGALLGLLWTNFVWDAHFRPDGETRPTVFTEDRGPNVRWKPTVDDVDGRLAFGIALGF